MTTATNTAPKMAYGFDDEDFDAELEAATKFQGNGTPKARIPFRAEPGFKVTFAKGGIFSWKQPNPKDPKKELSRSVSSFEGIIVDSAFTKEYWAKGEDGKDKLICKPVAHRTAKDEEGQRSGSGIWPIPAYKERAIAKYDPLGSRGVACAECPDNGVCNNGGNKGGIFVYVTALDGGTDEEGTPRGMIELKNKFLFRVQTPDASGISYNTYMRAMRGDGFKLNEVITTFEIEPTPNGLSNMLKLSKSEPAAPELIAEAKKAYMDGIAEIEAEREKRNAEWKAKQEAKKNGNTKVKTVTMANTEEDDEVFSIED